METINTIAKELQTMDKGTELYDLKFGELFELVQVEAIEPKARSFRKELNGDIAEGISIGFDVLMRTIDAWERQGDFITFFKKIYNRDLINKVKSLKADKRQHEESAGNVFLSEPIGEDGDRSHAESPELKDRSLYVFDTYDDGSETTFDELLEQFGEEHPEKYDLINIMISMPEDSGKKDFTSEVCVYYGVQKYSQVQKKVSRAREAFAKHLNENNYNIAV
ncbi:hypothetical protein [Halobacillus karajensis]|uniref:hypothetical protein n=1 Tax=Halobacillus karajensis TaxID=195088 RepID=UPI00045D0EC4|nr:hypothetical protein [Halobacillus karajensis]CDQ21724.1 hypothetical protein BN982_04133 [Halobacillus karajensis]